MRDNFKKQFQNLRDIILTNAKTINDLVEQANNLSELIYKMKATDSETNQQLISQLEELRQNIGASVDILIQQTHKLFEAFDKLIEEAVKK